MRVLEGNAEISTRYGGGFVQSIEGARSGRARRPPLRLVLLRQRGRVAGRRRRLRAATAARRSGGTTATGGDATRVPAVVGSWPQPFADGYEGRRRPVAVECRGGGGAPAATVRAAAGGRPGVAVGEPARRSGAIRVLVGPWARLRDDPAAALIEDGPAGERRLRRLRAGRGARLRAASASTKPARPAPRASAPTPAWSPPPAATKRRRSGS